jgi:NAD(P)H-dependent FMN reductase
MLLSLLANAIDLLSVSGNPWGKKPVVSVSIIIE